MNDEQAKQWRRAQAAEADRDQWKAQAEAAAKDVERLSWLDRDDIQLGFGVDPCGGPFVTIQDSKGKLLACDCDIRSAIDALLAAKEQVK